MTDPLHGPLPKHGLEINGTTPCRTSIRHRQLRGLMSNLDTHLATVDSARVKWHMTSRTLSNALMTPATSTLGLCCSAATRVRRRVLWTPAGNHDLTLLDVAVVRAAQTIGNGLRPGARRSRTRFATNHKVPLPSMSSLLTLLATLGKEIELGSLVR